MLKVKKDYRLNGMAGPAYRRPLRKDFPAVPLASTSHLASAGYATIDSHTQTTFQKQSNQELISSLLFGTPSPTGAWPRIERRDANRHTVDAFTEASRRGMPIVSLIGAVDTEKLVRLPIAPTSMAQIGSVFSHGDSMAVPARSVSLDDKPAVAARKIKPLIASIKSVVKAWQYGAQDQYTTIRWERGALFNFGTGCLSGFLIGGFVRLITLLTILLFGYNVDPLGQAFMMAVIRMMQQNILPIEHSMKAMMLIRAWESTTTLKEINAILGAASARSVIASYLAGWLVGFVVGLLPGK